MLIRLYFFLCMVGVIAISCNKVHTPQAVAVHGADSLTQGTYTVSRSDEASGAGIILLTPFNPTAPPDSGRLMVMDGDGHLITRLAMPARATNFQRWMVNGLVRYTWHVVDSSLHSPTSGGYVVIADERFQELRRVSLLAYGGITDVSFGLDVHDFVLLSDNHYIALAYNRRMVNNIPASIGTGGTAFIDASVIQEVQDGQVIWQWEGNDYPEFYTTSVEGNNYNIQTKAQDYMHVNAMAVNDADGNLLVSMRNCNQIIKVNRQTGQVLWRLGGTTSDFPLTPDMQFLRQHHVSFADGGHTLMLLDNGDITLRPFSRILEFQLNESSHAVNGYKAFRIPEPFTQFTGSVQKMGNHYFIGGGTANYVLEIDYLTGKKILQLNSNGFSSYRALKY